VVEAKPWIGLAARLAAGAVWLVAGAVKATDFTSFQAEVRAYDVLPGSLVEWVAYGLPLLEIALGAYLVAGLMIRPAAALSCALMAVFIAAQAQAWARGLNLDCGCFGSIARQRVGAGSIARDLALAVPSVAALAWADTRLSLDGLRRPAARGG
jgi:uncharacterized membrane protein YphA (DoxX/SURF4 family)